MAPGLARKHPGIKTYSGARGGRPAPVQYTIPLRTPFSLTASGSDADGDTLTYMWEQNDRGGNGTGLVSNTKLDGPLFRQFGVAAIVSDQDSLLYNSPGENAASTDPTRVFPISTRSSPTTRTPRAGRARRPTTRRHRRRPTASRSTCPTRRTSGWPG